jgi:anti-sigma B factor antagonist
MKFSVTVEDLVTIFHLHEPRLDTNNASRVKTEFLMLCQGEIDVLIIDLEEIEFCDSSGLSAILLAERLMRERDKEVVLVDPLGKVSALMNITKLTSIIPVFASMEEAKNALTDE